MADCFFLSTRYDPVPKAALEAIASGLPLITTMQCGAAEFVESGVEGYACCDALDVVEPRAAPPGCRTRQVNVYAARRRWNLTGWRRWR